MKIAFYIIYILIYIIAICLIYDNRKNFVEVFRFLVFGEENERKRKTNRRAKI